MQDPEEDPTTESNGHPHHKKGPPWGLIANMSGFALVIIVLLVVLVRVRRELRKTDAPPAPPVDRSATAAPDGTKPPSEEECRKLALRSLLDWNQGVQNKDFTAFAETASTKFQRQVSLARLMETFQPFIDKHLNIDSIKDVQPTFIPAPSVDVSGTLLLSGEYFTKPDPVLFRLRYIFEDASWKLIDIAVDVKPDTPEQP